MKIDIGTGKVVAGGALLLVALWLPWGCSRPGVMTDESAALHVYVPPGEHDDYYAFMSGGFSGQMTVYGLPSGRLLKLIPVFTQHGENGYGYSEETKPLLETSYGFVPWDDLHHPKLSQTDGIADGRWLFANGNNTPRVARIDLSTFETVEILEIPHSAGNHGSPFLTENTEYVVASTRFSVPIPQQDVPIDSYEENFRGNVSFISVDPQTGRMSLAFQILAPGFHYDIAHAGKGPSHGWSFFTTYNTEKAYTLLEVNASQADKDFIAAVNWKKAEEYLEAGDFQTWEAEYFHNVKDPHSHAASSEVIRSVRVLDPREHPGILYLLPTPKSPHGVDVDPTGEYIVAGGKLATVIPVHSFSNMLKAIENEDFDGHVEGIQVLRYESVIAGEVENPGLGPLHTEFDGRGYAYTSAFISSEIVKWRLGTWEVVDRVPTYYSIGHLMIPGGDSRKPWGDYVIALNKVTKDRYLPTGPELVHSAQLYDISGDRMRLLLDFPTLGEPHYAQAIPADLIKERSVRFYPLEKNTHPHAVKSPAQARVERNGSEVRVYMTTIRTHFRPDNIEGIRVGDRVYFHVTNLEQDWDIPHGFAIKGANNAELLVMPGETKTLLWEPRRAGVYPFYCTDFCSALHQEMQGYVRVSPEGSDVPLLFRTGED